MSNLPAVLEAFLAYRHGKENRHIFAMQLFVANAPKIDFPRLQRALKNLKYNNEKNGRWHVSFSLF